MMDYMGCDMLEVRYMLYVMIWYVTIIDTIRSTSMR
jgi:hypothetical protein